MSTEQEFPMYSLTAPGMPLPGPDFVALANVQGDASLQFEGKGKVARLVSYGPVLRELYRSALYDPYFQMPVSIKNRITDVPYVPGGYLFQPADGPSQADVMLVGKHPGTEEVNRKTNFIGPTSQPLHDALRQLRVENDELGLWYGTNAVKHPLSGGGAMPANVIKNCAPLLAQEFRLIRPKFILCLGTDAAAAVVGRGSTVSSLSGRVVDYTFPVNETGDPEQFHTSKVMVVLHPAKVSRDPQDMPQFMAGLERFLGLIRGKLDFAVETDVHHEVVLDESRLGEIVDAIVADPDPGARIIAVDCEWHGHHPNQPGAFLRSIQFSHKGKHGYNVKLRYQYGRPAFTPHVDAAIPHLRRLFKSSPGRSVRVVGHFFRSDLPWLASVGIDLRPEFLPPQPVDMTPESLERAAAATAVEGGFDTGAASHAVNETAPRGLEALTARYTTAPRFDIPLDTWKAGWRKQRTTLAALIRRLKRQALKPAAKGPSSDVIATQLSDAEEKMEFLEQFSPARGYGGAPDDPWWDSYCCYDPDVTRRLVDTFNGADGKPGLSDFDDFGGSSRLPFLLNMLNQDAFYAMERKGLKVDMDRAAQLSAVYSERANQLVDIFRSDVDENGNVVGVNWPSLNPRSQQQMIEALFGESYNVVSMKGNVRRLRPEGARSLGLLPIKTTKGSAGRPLPWPTVVAKDEIEEHTPSTDQEVVGMLSAKHPILKPLAAGKLLLHAATTVLRPPRHGVLLDVGVDEVVDWDDVFEKGVLHHLQYDGRLRSTFGNAETGRATSSRPNCQNFASAKEDAYRVAMGAAYRWSIRSLIQANPGCVIVESDIRSAEICGMAWESGDPVMIEDLRRSLLPTSDPDHVEFHSNIAVMAFGLKCAPTQAAIEAAGYKALRVIAKSIIFGKFYGRQLLAIAAAIRATGYDISDEQVAAVDAKLMGRYVIAMEFIRRVEAAVANEGLLVSGAGRRRRFYPTEDFKVLNGQKREGVNFMIQGKVADHITEAMFLLQQARRQRAPSDPWFDMLLQLHDAIYFEMRPQSVGWFHDNVLVPCMSTRIPVYRRTLEGELIPGQEPHFFEVDVKVYTRWTESIGVDEAAAMGLDARFASKKKK